MVRCCFVIFGCVVSLRAAVALAAVVCCADELRRDDAHDHDMMDMKSTTCYTMTK